MTDTIKVFISYTRKDVSAAKRLYENLKKAGLDPWFDKEVLLPGQDWEFEIHNANPLCIIRTHT